MVGLKRYVLVTSFLLAIFVFFAGIAVGRVSDDFRANKVLDILKQNELDTESFVVETQFINTFGGNRCELLNIRVNSMNKNLNEVRSELNTLSGAGSKNENYEFVKRKYFILEVRFFMLLENLKEMCGADHNTVLFFYKIGDTESIRQGAVLDALAREMPNLVTLSLDNEDDEPLIDLLVTKYSIKKTPALIINSKRVFEGFTSLEDLKPALSNKMNNTTN